MRAARWRHMLTATAARMRRRLYDRRLLGVLVLLLGMYSTFLTPFTAHAQGVAPMTGWWLCGLPYGSQSSAQDACDALYHHYRDPYANSPPSYQHVTAIVSTGNSPGGDYQVASCWDQTQQLWNPPAYYGYVCPAGYTTNAYTLCSTSGPRYQFGIFW